MAGAGAGARAAVAVACKGLGLSSQGCYTWLKAPVSQRDWDDAHVIDVVREIHRDDPSLGYRFLTGELADVGVVASENRVWRLCMVAGIVASHARRRSTAGLPGARLDTRWWDSREESRLAIVIWIETKHNRRHPHRGRSIRQCNATES